MIPTLETDRLVLRELRDEDATAMALLFADETTAKFIGGVCDEEDAWRRMAVLVGHWTLRGFGYWAVEVKQTSEFAGIAGLWFPRGWAEREAAYSLLSAHHSKGYATEAVARVRDHAYRDLGWATLVSCIALENTPSIRVAEKLGAKFERETMNRGWKVGVWRYPGPGEQR